MHCAAFMPQVFLTVYMPSQRSA